MRLEVISIGSELLTGKTTNTNVTFIGNQALLHGYKVAFVQTIEDSQEEIEAALKSALKRADFVITTGGLGPTGDDITKNCIATFFGKEMQYHPQIEKELDIRFPGIAGHETQATYPEGATLLHNPIGTALGCIVEGKVACLPGVPSQMQRMFIDKVIPFLQTYFPSEYSAKALYIAGKIEGDVDPLLRELEKRYPDVEIGICPSWGQLSVYCVGKKRGDVSACIQAISEQFSEDIYSEESPDISEAVHTLLQQKKTKFACAESCTGGYVSAQITKHAGASDYFLGSVVSYSNEAKEKMLGVSPKTLEQFGAVSEETAKEMALGTKAALESDIALAITGIAGPAGGSAEKPVGTVWIALVNQNNEITTKKCAPKVSKKSEKGGGSPHQREQVFCGGDRKKIIEYAANTALQMVWRECT